MLITNNVLTQLSHLYARLMKQYNCKSQTMLLTKIAKQDEVDQILDEIHLFLRLEVFQSGT